MPELKCEYDDCNEVGTPFPAWQGIAPMAILCEHHAQGMGFCLWCTGFFGSTEADEWNIYRTGYCYQCEDDIRAELGEFDEYDDEVVTC